MQQNGSYHSADNGFACAAAGRGITEALREHLNVIPFLRDYIALATLIKYENPVSFAIAA